MGRKPQGTCHDNTETSTHEQEENQTNPTDTLARAWFLSLSSAACLVALSASALRSATCMSKSFSVKPPPAPTSHARPTSWFFFRPPIGPGSSVVIAPILELERGGSGEVVRESTADAPSADRSRSCPGPPILSPSDDANNRTRHVVMMTDDKQCRNQRVLLEDAGYRCRDSGRDRDGGRGWDGVLDGVRDGDGPVDRDGDGVGGRVRVEVRHAEGVGDGSMEAWRHGDTASVSGAGPAGRR
eukprot:572746-Rhodomonas_salina.2